MRLQLTPSFLSAYRELEYDDRHHKLIINNQIAPLTPKEYALTMALLRQRKKWQESEGQAILCMSVALLMQITSIRPRDVLIRHLSNAGAKLAAFGIHIVSARTYGYLILFDPEIA
jgi:DNA-binding response OmpR family regulator